MTETFIKERKHNLTGKMEPVGIDDASAFLCRFENGSLATFEATRYARGHKALIHSRDQWRARFGDLGSARSAPHCNGSIIAMKAACAAGEAFT